MRSDMKSFLRLYLKELKFLAGMASIFLLALFIIFLARIIEDFTIVIDEYRHGYAMIHRSQFGWLFWIGLPYYFPVILVYSLYIENRSKTVYQLAALPSRRWLIPSAKFLAVVSVGLLCAYISNIINYQPWGNYITYYGVDYYRLVRMYERLGWEYPSKLKVCLSWITDINMFRNYSIMYLQLLLNCSFIVFASILADILKKQKILTLISVFLALFAVYLLIEFNLKPALHNWSLHSPASRMFLEFGIQTMFVMVFILSALILYDRYKEV